MYIGNTSWLQSAPAPLPLPLVDGSSGACPELLRVADSGAAALRLRCGGSQCDDEGDSPPPLREEAAEVEGGPADPRHEPTLHERASIGNVR